MCVSSGACVCVTLIELEARASLNGPWSLVKKKLNWQSQKFSPHVSERQKSVCARFALLADWFAILYRRGPSNSLIGVLSPEIYTLARRSQSLCHFYPVWRALLCSRVLHFLWPRAAFLAGAAADRAINRLLQHYWINCCSFIPEDFKLCLEWIFHKLRSSRMYGIGLIANLPFIAREEDLISNVFLPDLISIIIVLFNALCAVRKSLKGLTPVAAVKFGALYFRQSALFSFILQAC